MLLFSIVICIYLGFIAIVGTNVRMNGLLDINSSQLLWLFLSAFIVIIILLIKLLVQFRYMKPVAKIIETLHKIDKGDFDIRFTYDEENEFGEIAIAFNNLMDTVVNNTNEIEKARKELQSLTNNIPGGVYQCRDDISYTLHYISDGFMDVVGYKRDEIFGMKKGKIMNFIHPDDREFVVQHINMQLARNNTFEIQYRMVRKDHSICWVLNKGMCVLNELTGEFELNGVIIDITALTKAMEQRRKNDENYRIIGEQTSDAIFEWDFANDRLSFSPNWYDKFSYEPIKENASEALLQSKNVYPDDLNAFRECVKKTFKSKENTFVEVRLKVNKDHYIWVRIRTTAILDEKGNPVKAVGAIMDINHQKMKEEQLLRKAEFDILTKVYNRGAFEDRAKAKIEEAKRKKTQLAFLFIDIDDFRYYNSEYGHSLGDKIIAFIGQQIKEIIKGIGFAGRNGGDEFIICIYDQQEIKHVDDIAKELIQKLKKGFYDEQHHKIFSVDCSIGIALFPNTADTYAQLIINADETMYKAKQEGKGRFLFYHSNK